MTPETARAGPRGDAETGSRNAAMLGGLHVLSTAIPEPKQDVPCGPSPDAIAAGRDLVFEGLIEGEHARSWGVSRRELRNVIVMAHPESWVAPLE
jgi:hypothetical protein